MDSRLINDPRVAVPRINLEEPGGHREGFVCNMDCRICQERFKQNHKLPLMDRYKTTYERSYTKPKDIQAAFRRFEHETGATSNKYGPDAYHRDLEMQQLETDRAEFPFGRKRKFFMKRAEDEKNRYYEVDFPENETDPLCHFSRPVPGRHLPIGFANDPFIQTNAAKYIEHTDKATQYSQQGSATKTYKSGQRQPSPIRLHDNSPPLTKRDEEFLRALDREFQPADRREGTHKANRPGCKDILPVVENLGTRFADWMSTPSLQAMCINELLIPTAHNAHSYKIHDAFPLDLNHIISQACDVYGLLLGGVRCLEIRLHNDRWCSVQRFKTVRITEIANLIGKFCQDYPTEVVFLDIQNENNQLGSDHISLQKLLNDVSGNRLAKNLTDTTTVGELVRTKKTLILMWGYKCDQLTIVDSVFETTAGKPDQVIQKCQRWALKQPVKTDHSGYLKMLSCYVSPPKDAYVIGGNVHVLDSNLRQQAEVCNSLIKSYLLSDDIINRVHFIKMDFVHPDIVSRMVDYNLHSRRRGSTM